MVRRVDDEADRWLPWAHHRGSRDSFMVSPANPERVAVGGRNRLAPVVGGVLKHLVGALVDVEAADTEYRRRPGSCAPESRFTEMRALAPPPKHTGRRSSWRGRPGRSPDSWRCRCIPRLSTSGWYQPRLVCRLIRWTGSAAARCRRCRWCGGPGWRPGGGSCRRARQARCTGRRWRHRSPVSW